MEDFVLSHERGIPQIAANRLGWFFIRGIESALEEGMDLLSVLSVSCFPQFTKIFIRSGTRRRKNGRELVFAPYINLPLLKRSSMMLSTMLQLARWLHSTRKVPNRIVTVYAMYTATFVAAAIVCRWFRVPCVLIVPDLPEYIRPGYVANSLFARIRELNMRMLHRLADQMQGFIFLTKHMAERFHLGSRPFDVVEGFADVENGEYDQKPSERGHERAVMYAGILSAVYGVRMLVQAFMRLKNPSYRLWLCGRGELEPEILSCAEEDSRIKFLGMVSNSEVLQRERCATLLVNPRPSDSEFTRYSFPSKNLEYLSSGRPVVLCRLPGIPDEYFDYVYALDNESVEGMATLLDHVLQKSDEELEAFGQRARRFVLDHKNYRKQGERVRRVMELVQHHRPMETTSKN
jgi:glycosyltransferase involved in cell wall biosynthesis